MKEDRERTTSVPELFKLMVENTRDQVAEDHMNCHLKIMEQATRAKTVKMFEEELEVISAIKGGGRGKGQGKVKSGSGHGRNEAPVKDPRFSATVTCKHCGKHGHYIESCYSKQREDKKAEQALKKAEGGVAKCAAPSGPAVPLVIPVAPLPPAPAGEDKGRRKRQRL